MRRAWQTLTPAEKRVLETIKGLPKIQRTRNGFKRRELKVKGVSDRRVKEILKSLTDTGYLDCEGRQGPQGYTYTLVRDVEEISLASPSAPPLTTNPAYPSRMLSGGKLSPDTARCPIAPPRRMATGKRAKR